MSESAQQKFDRQFLSYIEARRDPWTIAKECYGKTGLRNEEKVIEYARHLGYEWKDMGWVKA